MRLVGRIGQALELSEAKLPTSNVITGAKVFSATKSREREYLGELITDWIRAHPELELVDKIVTQSSDAEFHCLTITIFYRH